jgi:hypothetical protein
MTSKKELKQAIDALRDEVIGLKAEIEMLKVLSTTKNELPEKPPSVWYFRDSIGTSKTFAGSTEPTTSWEAKYLPENATMHDNLLESNTLHDR